MSKKPVQGWAPFESLKKIPEMSPEEVMGEIQIRGGNNLICSWETKCGEQNFPIIKDVVGGTRKMTKEFFVEKPCGTCAKKP